MYLNAKDFSKKYGLPVQLIRRFCRDGTLRYFDTGKEYLLDEARTLSALTKMEKNQSQMIPQVEHVEKRGSFSELIKRRKREATQNGQT